VGDAIFNDPRLVRVYDAIEGDRRDLEVYVEVVDELGARSVLDVGCGTGTFACMLAARGIDVVGVDPAWASLEIARAKPGAAELRWVHGDATTLPPLALDAAFMTGNVAQVFLTDEDWAATLRGTWEALRPGGHLVFETRDPAQRAWERWTPELTRSVLDVPGVGVVEDWGELTEVSGQFVTFRSTTVFRSENLVIESTSTLRFRDRSEIEDSLVAAGFQTVEIRDAPDRPGLEFVYIAVRPH
jgi:SAM-dependent methyltransferase